MSNTEHELNLSTSHCFICSAGLKLNARFCSHCGQPVIVATRANLEATTRRLAMPVFGGGASTQPLNKPKARPRNLLALSLAVNCLLVMAFAGTAIHNSVPRDEMARLVTSFAAPDDSYIFLDANHALEPSIPENLSDMEESLSDAFTPPLKTECPSLTEPDTPRRKERTFSARRINARAERTMNNATRNTRRSELIKTSSIRLIAERKMSEADDEMTFEMRQLPLMIKTAFDKARTEAGRERTKFMREERRRNALPPVRNLNIHIPVACATSDTPAEAPAPPPAVVIKAATLEEVGL